jgi:hypothetical protein
MVSKRQPNMGSIHRLCLVGRGGIGRCLSTISRCPAGSEMGHLPNQASRNPPVCRRGGMEWRPSACQSWQPPIACQIRQVAFHLLADEVGWNGAQKKPPSTAATHCLPQGEAEWDIGESMILRRRDGAEMVQPPKKASDIPPASS